MDQQTLIAWLSLAVIVILQGGAGLFILGRLFERVGEQGRRIKDLEDAEANGEGGLGKLREAFAEFRGAVSAKLDSQVVHMESMQRTIEGQSRQLANIATNRIGLGGEFSKSPAE